MPNNIVDYTTSVAIAINDTDALRYYGPTHITYDELLITREYGIVYEKHIQHLNFNKIKSKKKNHLPAWF